MATVVRNAAPTREGARAAARTGAATRDTADGIVRRTLTAAAERQARRRGAVGARARPALPPRVMTAAVRSLQLRENLVEQVHDRLQQARQSTRVVVVEQAGDGAEEIAEQVARPLLCRDLQVHLVQIDDQAEQVEVQRPERQVED